MPPGRDYDAPLMTGFWNGRHVAVRGGAGFMGSRVVERLRAAGVEPLVPRSKDHTLVDGAAFKQLFKDARPEMVIHAAVDAFPREAVARQVLLERGLHGLLRDQALFGRRQRARFYERRLPVQDSARNLDLGCPGESYNALIVPPQPGRRQPERS
jgi:hypothetical protein